MPRARIRKLRPLRLPALNLKLVDARTLDSDDEYQLQQDFVATFGLTAVFEPILARQWLPYGEVMRMVLLGNDERISVQNVKRGVQLVLEIVQEMVYD